MLLGGMFCLGNLIRESGVVDRLSNTAQNELINITTIFLGLAVGCLGHVAQYSDHGDPQGHIRTGRTPAARRGTARRITMERTAQGRPRNPSRDLPIIDLQVVNVGVRTAYASVQTSHYPGVNVSPSKVGALVHELFG